MPRMRTTLTLDPDVAAEIQRRRRSGDRGLKEEINRLLRLGLLHDEESSGPAQEVRTRAFSVGKVLVAGIDDVAGALARAEGEGYR
jgi:hypothetical protein